MYVLSLNMLRVKKSCVLKRTYMMARVCFQVGHVIIKNRQVRLSLIVYIVAYNCFILKMHKRVI